MSANARLAITSIAIGAALLFAAWALRGLAMYAAGFFSAALLFCLFPELDLRVRALAGWARGLLAGVGKMAPAPVARKPIRLMSLIPGIPAPFGLPWPLIACVAFVFAILAALHFFGEYREAQGVSKERARWERRIAEASREMDRAAVRIGAEHRERTDTLTEALDHGREQIHTAVNSHETRDLFLAFAAADRRLCDAGGGCGG